MHQGLVHHDKQGNIITFIQNNLDGAHLQITSIVINFLIRWSMDKSTFYDLVFYPCAGFRPFGPPEEVVIQFLKGSLVFFQSFDLK